MSKQSSHKNENANNTWNFFREKDLASSFGVVEEWIRENATNIERSVIRKNRLKKRRKLALLSVVVAVLVCSFIFKTETWIQYGYLVVFKVAKNNTGLIGRLASIQDQNKVYPVEQINNGEHQFYVGVIKGEKIPFEVFDLLKNPAIKTGNITALQYKIKQSLFSGLLQRVMSIKKPPEQNVALIENMINEELKRNEIWTTVKLTDDGELKFTSAIDSGNNLGSVDTIVDTMSHNKETPPTVEIKEVNRIDLFNWLHGPWKVKNVPNDTWHYWRKSNDSLLTCLVLEKTENGKIQIHEGFSISLKKSTEIILALKRSQWKFIRHANGEYIFRNSEEPNPDVKWMMKDGNNAWQSMVYSDYNAEFINLTREDPSRFDKMIKDLGIPHPRLQR